MQERYWREMIQTKYSEFYIDLYLENSVIMDRRINVLLAIASCGSIASWAIWNQFALIWALIVAASQVVSVIKPYLPYSKRVEDLYNYSSDIKGLYIKMEYDWFYVSNGDFTEEEINETLFKYKTEYNTFTGKHLQKDYLTMNDIIKAKAESFVEEYFKKNY